MFWVYTLGRGFKRTKLKVDDYYQHHVPLPRLASFNSRLLHYSDVKPHRTTLLNILSLQQENLRDLSDMRQVGGGSLAKGVLTAITDVAASIADTGTTLFHIVTGSALSVANDTVTLFDKAGKSILGVFDVVGGPSGFALYLIDICIIGYLVWKHVNDNRRHEVER